MSKQEQLRREIPAITGIGAAFGERIITNGQIAQDMGIDDNVLKRMIGKTGIQERRWVNDEQLNFMLSSRAIQQALGMAGVDKSTIKSVALGTSSQSHLAVPESALVQHALGLPKRMRVVDPNNACASWVQALYETFIDLSSPLGRKGPQIAVGSEVISRWLHPKVIQTYPLFGDAAGAVVVDNIRPDEGAPDALGFDFGVDGSLGEAIQVPAGGSACPINPALLEQLQDKLHMSNGRIVKEQAILNMSQATKNALQEAGCPQEEVAYFFFHQANEEIIRGVADSLGISGDRVIITIDQYGNTSGATIPTSLRFAWEKNLLQRNQIIAGAALGAGVTFGAFVISMVGLPKR